MDKIIQSWLETPAAAFLAAMGLPVPSENELRFEAERDMRAAALRRFNEAHRPGETTHERTAYEYQRELAERAQATRGWIPLGDGDATVILRRIRAQRLADEAASDATVYGPDTGNPRTAEALEQMRLANERIADFQRGYPFDPGHPSHVGRTVQ
jgi:hypothetical protein